jgi:hypothetical protein
MKKRESVKLVKVDLIILYLEGSHAIFFGTASKGKTTMNGEHKFGSYLTDNTKHMDFEVHSANGISGKIEPLRAKFRVL